MRLIYGDKIMKLFCKQCGYNREKSAEYEYYECPICFSIMNEDKKEFFNTFDKPEIENETIGLDEVIKTLAINSFVRDIKHMGKDRAFKTIEGLSNPLTRANNRKFYFLALEEIEREV